MKLSSRKIALHFPVVYSTDRSKAVVPVLVLLFVALWFNCTTAVRASDSMTASS